MSGEGGGGIYIFTFILTSNEIPSIMNETRNIVLSVLVTLLLREITAISYQITLVTNLKIVYMHQLLQNYDLLDPLLNLVEYVKNNYVVVLKMLR